MALQVLEIFPVVFSALFLFPVTSLLSAALSSSPGGAAWLLEDLPHGQSGLFQRRPKPANWIPTLELLSFNSAWLFCEPVKSLGLNQLALVSETDTAKNHIGHTAKPRARALEAGTPEYELWVNHVLAR